jgi:hypothetical protein
MREMELGLQRPRERDHEEENAAAHAYRANKGALT